MTNAHYFEILGLLALILSKVENEGVMKFIWQILALLAFITSIVAQIVGAIH